MAELWTAFVWGLGGSCGVAFGAIVFLVAKTLANKALGRADSSESALAFNRDSLEQLTRRNDLTVNTIESLDRIAEAIEERHNWAP